MWHYASRTFNTRQQDPGLINSITVVPFPNNVPWLVVFKNHTEQR